MKLKIIGALCLLALFQTAMAEEKIENKSETISLTTHDIIEILIKEGFLTQERAQTLISAIALEKSAEPKDDENKEQVSEIKANVVRVPYIPEFVRQQIRDELRIGLKEEVVNDVLAQAEHERWGVPDVLPSWTRKLNFKGDFRLRYQGDFFADNNQLTGSTWYFDAQEVNEQGELGTDPTFYHNILEDRNRLRARLRLAMDAKVTEGVKVGMRLATGKFDDPVSTNQTMGNSGKPYTLILDRAFIKTNTRYNQLTFWGGRMPNPWMSSDLVWDADLNFDGLAFQYRPLESDDLDADERIFDTFITFGAFPLEEVELSSKDKWLYGLQTGFSWSFLNQSRLDIAFAYYDYTNIEGERNDSLSNLNDYTAPDLISTGNTLFNIANNPLNTDETLLALASDYNLFNVMIQYKLAKFAPVNIVLTADYVKNIGYKQSDVLNRTGGTAGLISVSDNDDGAPRVEGYMLGIGFGWPDIRLRGNWDVSMAYKYLERDAVLDIYTDSDFRNGGTDVEGWSIQGRYAVEDNTWLSLKFISADEIDGPPYGVDTVQFDLNASF